MARCPSGLARLGTCAALLLALAASPAGATAPMPSNVPAPELQTAFDQAWQVLLAGDYERGLPQIEAVLELSRQTLGGSHVFTLKTQDYLGGTLMRMGRLVEARQTFEAILQQHQQAGTQDSLAALSSLNNLAKCIESLESPQAALPMYEQAMALRQRLVGPDHLDSVTVLDDYASALGETGQWHEALRLLTQALALRMQGLGPQHQWTLTSQNNLAHLLSRLGRYPEALALNEQVLQARLASPGESHPSTWSSMSNTAVGLQHVGRHEEALLLHQRALAHRQARWPATHPSVLSSRRGLAQTLRAMGRLDEAETTLRHLLQDSIAAFGAPHHQAQSTRLVLAEVLVQARQWAPALALLVTTEAHFLETAGPLHFNTLQAGVMRAGVACRLGQKTAAPGDWPQLLARIETYYGADAPLLQSARRAQAACLLARGEGSTAEALLRTLLAQATVADAELSLWDDPRNDHSLAQAHLHRQHALALAQMGRLSSAFAALEQGKARQLVAQLSERAAAQAAGVPAEEQAQMQTAQERLFASKAALRELTRPAERPAQLARLQAAAHDLQALRTRWEQTHPAFRRITQLPAVQAQRDARLLPRQALLVSYLFDEDQHLWAFSLTPSGELRWHPLGWQPHLAAHVEAFRLAASQSGGRVLLDDRQVPVDVRYWRQADEDRWQVLPRHAPSCTPDTATSRNCSPAGSRPATEADLAALRQHLSRSLLAPMGAGHPTTTGHRQWVISPDGPLGALPWDLLTWRGQPVVASVAVSQLPSLAVLKAQHQLRASRSAGGPPRDLALLAVGNPRFDAPPTQEQPGRDERQGAASFDPTIPSPPQQPAHWPALPASALEMQLAAAAFPHQATLQLSGAQASKAQLLQASAAGELARARHLLLATHVWYHPDRPQDSRLILSPDPAPADSAHTGPAIPPPTARAPSLLSPVDIMGLRLSSDLTVLAACNSARSDVAPDGRSQLGFAYALQVAGNRNALLALWPVSDRSTGHFTARFFRHLALGLDHAAALKATKREFMHHAHAPWRAPQHWAGFVLVGA